LSSLLVPPLPREESLFVLTLSPASRIRQLQDHIHCGHLRASRQYPSPAPPTQLRTCPGRLSLYPSTAGSYTLQASTSIETIPVISAAYTIANLPRTLIVVSPANPDGLASFYKTRPTIAFTAISSTDPTPVVLFHQRRRPADLCSSIPAPGRQCDTHVPCA